MFHTHDDTDTSMTPHSLAASLGIALFAAFPAFADAVANPSESNINWAIVLPIAFFLIGQAVNVGLKLLFRYWDAGKRKADDE